MNKKVLYFQTKFLAEKKEWTITIKGFGSTGDVDRHNDKVLPTAFAESVDMFMKNPVMLLQHDDNKVIGKFSSTDIRSNGLEVVWEVMYDIDGCMKKIEDGVLGAFSIGFITQAYQYEDSLGHILYKSDEGLMAGYSWDDLYNENTYRIITKLDLVEISVVSTPANPYALFQVAKDFFIEETKALKSLATQKKWAPNEIEEEATGESPAEITPTPTGEEVPTGESPETPEEKSIESTTPEDTEATPPESGSEEPTDTPTGITEEEVKALIAEAVETVSKELSLAFEQKLATLSSENEELKALIAKIEEKSAKIEKDVLKIEVPRGSTRSQWVKRVILTDEMVLKTIGR